MQISLFPDTCASDHDAESSRVEKPVLGATIDEEISALAKSLPPSLRMGTSSWYFPGWAAQVWAKQYPEVTLSRYGLPAYAQHPLLRCVSIDRTYYRPLDAAQFALYAAQVPDDFRFVVKAPALIADALIRDGAGRGLRPNPTFLHPDTALRHFVTPALEGLGHKLGALVFQLSPLPLDGLSQLPRLIVQLRRLLDMLAEVRARIPGGVVAVEVRDREWLCDEFVTALRSTGATYCLGLHPRMPSIDEQLPILRELWPAPLVCRWNLNAKHGAFGYEEARDLYAPFDKLVDEDPATCASLARLIAGSLRGGQPAYVIVNNKAEGSAPLSIRKLAKAVQVLA